MRDGIYTVLRLFQRWENKMHLKGKHSVLPFIHNLEEVMKRITSIPKN
jgi:hypothetical protein